MESLQISYTRNASRMLFKITDYYMEWGGKKAVGHLLDNIQQQETRISKFPETGFLEPLLRDRKLPYRSVFINRNIKMVYYPGKSFIRIVAFWDMRMNPDRLRRSL